MERFQARAYYEGKGFEACPMTLCAFGSHPQWPGDFCASAFALDRGTFATRLWGARDNTHAEIASLLAILTIRKGQQVECGRTRTAVRWSAFVLFEVATSSASHVHARSAACALQYKSFAVRYLCWKICLCDVHNCSRSA